MTDVEQLLIDMFASYPVETGGSCVRSAEWHSHMLNKFFPRYQKIILDLMTKENQAMGFYEQFPLNPNPLIKD